MFPLTCNDITKFNIIFYGKQFRGFFIQKERTYAVRRKKKNEELYTTCVLYEDDVRARPTNELQLFINSDV